MSADEYTACTLRPSGGRLNGDTRQHPRSPMPRRFRGKVKRDKPEHRINRHIRFREIRVIDPEGELLGVMSPDEGRAHARRHEFDLVEVSPNARPPVCKIMDYGKFKYERSKAKSAAKTQTTSLKTVQMRPKTDDHDLETKLGRVKKFLKRGDKVRLVMRLRGRENGYPQRWVAMLKEMYHESLSNLARVTASPSQQGRTVTMVLEPVS